MPIKNKELLSAFIEVDRKTEPKSDDNDDQDEKDEKHGVSLSLSEDDDNDSFWGSILEGFIEALIEAFFSGDRISMSLARVDQEARTDAGEVEIRRTGRIDTVGV